MRRSISLFSLVAALPAVHGLRFQGPAPTGISPERALNINIPAPTPGPLANELKKRQTNLSPATCGWVDGDMSSGVTCRPGRTCMLYTSSSVGMAGCCSGSDTELCGWTNRCIDYRDFSAGSCDASCQANDYVRKCIDTSLPYCVTWTYPGDGVADYGCAATSTNTIWTVLQRATDRVGGSTVMSLPTLSGDAVTGFKVGSSRTTRYAAPTAGDTFGSGTSGSDSGSETHTVRRIAVGVIIGIVVAVLTVIFFIAVGICICVKKKKKQRQLAADAQTIAAMQANRPQSMYPPPQQQYQPQQQPMQQQGPPPPAPQSPQPTLDGYFAPPAAGREEQKYNPHSSVHEYGATPISNPASPTPGYVQPGANQGAPAVPSNQQYTYAHYQNPAGGACEADSMGVSRPSPSPQPTVSPVGQYQSPGTEAKAEAHEVEAINRPRDGAHGRPVYEMGEGR
ncbi:hypothetical protein J1614_010441 [Plenodomus biglobosus]|nr:hypothetical protein J1614_010441 [Plenodomus biglobosus]